MAIHDLIQRFHWALNGFITFGLAVWSTTAVILIERDLVPRMPQLIQDWREDTIAGKDISDSTGGFPGHLGDRDLLASSHALSGVLGISAVFGFLTTAVVAYIMVKEYRDVFSLEHEGAKRLAVKLKNTLWTFAFFGSLSAWLPIIILRKALDGIQPTSNENISGTLPASSREWNDSWWSVYLLAIGIMTSVSAFCHLVLGWFAYAALTSDED